MKSSAKKVVAEETSPRYRSINAQFAARLPAIVETIAQGSRFSKENLDKTVTAVEEFQDYITFEIKKVELDIAHLEWNSRTNPEELAHAKAWLSRLRELQKKYQVDGILQSVVFLTELRRAIQLDLM
jgi:DNA repair ATPase RecN